MTPTNEVVDISALPEEEIQAKLRGLSISLSAAEIRQIQNEILKRPPTLTECILFSIEGSEHCSYKSSRTHLKTLVTEGPNVILGAKEDAGIVHIATDRKGRRYGAVLSHESHNHPSQIVPYEGAATGVGGNVRDVCCMGAEVIAIADSLRFGDISMAKTKWIHEGVVAGIAGYGNPLGIPNLAGDINYDRGYQENCLVTIVTVGVVREDEIIHSYAPHDATDYSLILVGKATDNSGFGGASFASLELQEEEKEKNKGAVQEPNAFLERHLLKATYTLFELLKAEGRIEDVACKDLGAGGIACASVELADGAGYGVEVWLDEVPVSMNSLHPAVILCSETQERFMWVAPPDLTSRILHHYNKTFDLPGVSSLAQAKVIGKIRQDGQYWVHHKGETVVEAPAQAITKGFLYDRPYTPPSPRGLKEPDLPEPTDYNEHFLKLLAHENIASRAPVFETYDKQVQGRTVIEAGEADAGVIQPFNDERFPPEIQGIGLALATGQNPRYCRIDPYWGAINAVVEAVRNVAAVGAVPQAMTDCLCFGNPEKPEQMWEFVESIRGINQACRNIHLKGSPGTPIPTVAGNVSFYNESQLGAIPPSPLISCLGRLEDATQAITPAFKQTESILFLSGERLDECGGSIYYALQGELGVCLPKPDLTTVRNQIYALTDAISQSLVLAAHDIGEGGVAVALAEMSFGRGIGCQACILGELREDRKLFSETGGFLLEVAPKRVSAVKAIFSQHCAPLEIVGQTTASPFLIIDPHINLPITKAHCAWSEGLREKLF